MYIRKIELLNYRNYKELDMSFDETTNILYGDNAQGKTNILESIYVGGTTKSHRGSKDKEIVNFDEEESHVRIYLVKNEIEYKIDMHIRKSKSKVIYINGVPIRKAAELLGIINLVFFSPEDLSIIKNGPLERRRFIDMELSQLDSYYLYNLSNYNKTVNQRNKMLKDMYERPDQSLLDVFDEQLLLYGIKIIERRRTFISELNELIQDIHSTLSGRKELCTVYYEPDVEIEEYALKLKQNREKDIRYKTTSLGPHRDDMILKIGDVDIRKFGSQGQQRTAALSLKLAEIQLVKNMIHDTPVLLLDDVLSELDSNRQKFLLESIGDLQTIITCTGLDDFVNNQFNINKTFHVVEGKVFE